MVNKNRSKSYEKNSKKITARRKEKERQNRINQILEAAKKVFITKGYDNASIREIALESKLSTGAIYVYFKGKSDLYGTILERILQKEIQYYKLASNTDGSIQEKLEAILIAHLKFDSDYPDESELLAKNLDELDLTQTLRKRLDNNLLEAHSLTVDVIEEGIKKGLFHKDLRKSEAAFLFYSAAEGIIYTTSYGHSFDFKINPEQMVKQLIAHLIEGMKVKT